MTTTSPRSRGRSLRPLLVVPVVVIAYYGVMAAIRHHVDGVIQQNTGHALPDFELADLTGTSYRRDQLAGKIAVLNFTRSHCVNCVEEEPEVRRFVEQLPADVEFWSVMTDPVLNYDRSDTEKTLARAAFTHPVLMANQAFVDAFHTVGWAHVTPITYFADANGTIVGSLRGAQTAETLRRALQWTRSGTSFRDGEPIEEGS